MVYNDGKIFSRQIHLLSATYKIITLLVSIMQLKKSIKTIAQSIILTSLFIITLMSLKPYFNLQANSIIQILLLMSLQYLCIFLPIIIYKQTAICTKDIQDKINLTKIVFKPIQYYLSYFIGLSILLFLITTAGLTIPGFGEQIAIKELIGAYIAHPIILYLSICIIAPILEEIYFRNFIMQTLSKNYSYRISNLIQATLFAIFHLEFTVFFPIFIYGYLLGKIRNKYGIYSSISLHILNNSLSFIILMYLQKV